MKKTIIRDEAQIKKIKLGEEFDANNKAIKNVPTGVESGDAVNKGQLLPTEQKVANLENNQVTGVVTYRLYTDLPNPGVAKVLYKVAYDPDITLRGSYLWTGTAYLKVKNDEYEEYINTSFADRGTATTTTVPNLDLPGLGAWTANERGTYTYFLDGNGDALVVNEGEACRFEEQSDGSFIKTVISKDDITTPMVVDNLLLGDVGETDLDAIACSASIVNKELTIAIEGGRLYPFCFVHGNTIEFEVGTIEYLIIAGDAEAVIELTLSQRDGLMYRFDNEDTLQNLGTHVMGAEAMPGGAQIRATWIGDILSVYVDGVLNIRFDSSTRSEPEWHLKRFGFIARSGHTSVKNVRARIGANIEELKQGSEMVKNMSISNSERIDALEKIPVTLADPSQFVTDGEFSNEGELYNITPITGRLYPFALTSSPELEFIYTGSCTYLVIAGGIESVIELTLHQDGMNLFRFDSGDNITGLGALSPDITNNAISGNSTVNASWDGDLLTVRVNGILYFTFDKTNRVEPEWDTPILGFVGQAGKTGVESVKIQGGTVMKGLIPWKACGDSITHQNKWQPTVLSLLPDILDSSAYENLGVSGSTFLCDGPNDIPIVTDTIVGFTGLITVWGSTNDFGQSQVLSSPSDTDRSLSTLGGVNSSLFNLVTNNPDAKIVYFTPIHRDWLGGGQVAGETNNNGDTLDDFRKGIIEVAELYSVEIIDLYAISGFNQITMSTWSADNLHPNTLGGVKIGNVIARKLRGMLE